ncbi:transposon Ty3-I Gag-Pol polyprotein [Nephila pilipes]|uniref:Transposon Ty3-I Gag-Pol polyprotein n=1 Tax=Nephila pilipes TaxID=299642 RepID=A0A8X6PS09_NEPPI|nr:transposon Ty3-I Gag-Pol polyprotein [Nephila pilipes]
MCTDYLTRSPAAKALATAEALEIVNFIIEEIILKNGSPREMINDRGCTFLFSIVNDIIRLCQISHLLATTYHQQIDGLIKKFYRTLDDMRSMYLLRVTTEDFQNMVYLYVTARQLKQTDCTNRAFKLLIVSFERLVMTKQFLDLDIEQVLELFSSNEIGARRVPNMTGKKSGKYQNYLGNNVVFLHCVAHQDTLCTSTLNMKPMLDAVVELVNTLRSRGLTHRQSRDFLLSMHSEYSDAI